MTTPEAELLPFSTPTPTGTLTTDSVEHPPQARSDTHSPPAESGPGSWTAACGRVQTYWERVEHAATTAGADPRTLGALLLVENSGERAVSPAGALGLMQLLPDKFRPGDDPFDVPTNLLRAAEHVADLQRRYPAAEKVAAAYFGAINAEGQVTTASDGNVTGPEYVRRFQAAAACIASSQGLPPPGQRELLSPLGMPITPAHISFGFLDDYGTALATYVRGAHGVERHGTLHLAWDLIIPGAPENGRGYPVLTPVSGRIIRTSDPVGGPFGLWLENDRLDLRVRLMHLDSLAEGIGDGTLVDAGRWVGNLGGQGTPEFPHLHLSLEVRSTGERLDPARFSFRSLDGSPGIELAPSQLGRLWVLPVIDRWYVAERWSGEGAVSTRSAPAPMPLRNIDSVLLADGTAGVAGFTGPHAMMRPPDHSTREETLCLDRFPRPGGLLGVATFRPLDPLWSWLSTWLLRELPQFRPAALSPCPTTTVFAPPFATLSANR